MISAKLLNSAATLNDYLYLGALSFIPGENLTFALQLFDPQRGTRYVPPMAAILTLEFTNKDSSMLTKTAAVIDSNDRSMWSTSLSQADTTNLSGQNVIVSLDVNGDGTVIQMFLMENIIQRTNLSGDC